MPVTLSLTEDQIFTVLGDFLTSILPSDVEIVRGLVNRVPPPTGPDYIVMTSEFRTRLATNVTTYDTSDPAPTTQAVLEPATFVAQIDVFGPASADNSQIICTLFRSEMATTFFAQSGFDVQPLYVEDPKQIPFSDGEQQYEERWTIDAVMQINPVVTVSQDFANQAVVGLIEVDAYYPPGG
jgi:hypothetical protein